MYLHVGKGKNIKDREIIGIFDLDTATISSITKGYINKKQKEGCVEYADTDLPRSFIICKEKGKEEKVVLSRISSTGLKERAQLNIIEEP
jgi:hypothetical protein